LKVTEDEDNKQTGFMENSQRYKAMREITDQTNVKYGSHHLK
jgi:hypothetical protein